MQILLWLFLQRHFTSRLVLTRLDLHDARSCLARSVRSLVHSFGPNDDEGTQEDDKNSRNAKRFGERSVLCVVFAKASLLSIMRLLRVMRNYGNFILDDFRKKITLFSV